MAMTKREIKKILNQHKLWLNGEADGKRADLKRANLQGADLKRANLQRADLQGANLQGANLQGAILKRANLDFSCWPLWCGSQGVKVNIQLAAQLAAHFCILDCEAEEYKIAREALLPFAKMSHRAKDLRLLGGA